MALDLAVRVVLAAVAVVVVDISQQAAATAGWGGVLQKWDEQFESVVDAGVDWVIRGRYWLNKFVLAATEVAPKPFGGLWIHLEGG